MEKKPVKETAKRITIRLDVAQARTLMLALEYAKSALADEARNQPEYTFRKRIEADVKAVDELLANIGGQVK